MIPSPAWARAGGAAIDHPHGQLWDSEQPNAAGSSPLAALEWAGLRFRLVPLGSDQGPPDY
ncbi:MAG: hypothetical protein KDC38_13200, partial [Planctomycetes bacterium]|nr:hypothetical protein [Planctomycetota bacterium]